MTALLTATRLSRTYGQLHAIQDVDLAVDAGARHAIIGPNGAGKSTLLHLLAGTIRPTRGRIAFDGRDITRVAPARRARAGIGRSFQTPATFGSLSTLDNLVVAAWRRTKVAAWHSSRYRELSRRALHQLDTIGLGAQAHTPAGSLSHGQQRLLDIAMALAAAPTLLLLDEPAAGLGDDDLHQLLAVIDGLSERMAVILVEHNLDVVAAVADTVTVLHEGQVLFTGTPTEAAAHPGVQEAYLGLPTSARA